ncbi:PIG-L deacetylase family protein [Paenibacillus oryzisoli]|uniref:GlcNAc-PI de-N-acetylase n=1 Tax=Paenibacillus oryzisoli TaxID=1850517 RepID=A0A198A016_9BACL|nr:PIG-L deacetylase family protein [Paenibacillus oryzisoli]OAS14515.1 GlcNAc-PI de-N-acetylase [Paenibacillus oryzisoli]
MNKVLVVAPHPDDETLGCGGTLLKHLENGDEIHWLIVTHINEENGFSKERINCREEEIEKTSLLYQFTTVHQLKFPTTQLDSIPMYKLVGEIGKIFQKIQPTICLVPYRGDAHSDHAAVFDATISCTKWFRYPSVNRVLVYETLSETDFGVNPDNNGFSPNVFVDISTFLNKKIEIMNVFASEMGEFPFPRSEKAIKSLAYLRGAASGFDAAEAFMLIRERL